MSPISGRVRLAALAITVVSALIAGPTVAIATFGDAATIDGNTFATATLQPPASPNASARCDGSSPTVDLGWTATASAFADGYQVLRSTTSGGPYELVATVLGRVTQSYADGGLAASTTYHYVLRATAINWRSVSTSEVSSTTAAC